MAPVIVSSSRSNGGLSRNEIEAFKLFVSELNHHSIALHHFLHTQVHLHLHCLPLSLVHNTSGLLI